MRKIILTIIHTAWIVCRAQELPASAEQEMEALADREEELNEDDSWQQQLSRFSKDPVNLNTAERDQLIQLGLLTDLQVSNLLSYRRLLGNIDDIHELQAIPGWDISMIRRLLPYITIQISFIKKEEWKKWFTNGVHSVLLRASQELDKPAELNVTGSPLKLFCRYNYIYKNTLQFGALGEKDAGEQFFSGTQTGFDFYSFHFFARKKGLLQVLALGDFTVNMGQGLVQWHNMAFKKSASVISVKRQSPVLRPYHSAGEFNFYRGAGITMRKSKLEATLFASLRKLSAAIDQDTATGRSSFGSFQVSGYHRTRSEIEAKSKLKHFVFGAILRYDWERLQSGIYVINHRFSVPMQKDDEPYNLFAIRGSNWYNIGMDYSYTFRNLHLFGELAMDRNLNRALLAGLLMSADPKVDIALLYRDIAARYQAVAANAFTENTVPSNEKGIYAGISIRVAAGWKFDAYADIYRFPWLKYRVDAPSSGADFMLQLTYTPNRHTEIYLRLKNESRQRNSSDETGPTHAVTTVPKQNCRLHIIYKLNKIINLRQRIELIWLDRAPFRTSGFLGYADIIYKPALKPFNAVMRFQYFETEGYDARLYAYENDVLYNYSVPAFSGIGWRYYVSINYDLNQKISVWLHWAQTLHVKNSNIAGVENKNDSSTSSVKCQLRVFL